MIHDVHTPDGNAEADLPAVAAEACAAPVRLHVAYLVNQYPKVSHSFIRREILALEQQGVKVDRIAVRGWDGDVVDPDDIAELGRTRYVLQRGLLPLLVAVVRQSVSRPRRFLSALRTAIAMMPKSERAFYYHLIYLAEACLVLEWLQESGATHLHAHFGTNPAEVAMLVRMLGGPPYSFTAHGPEESDRGAFLNLDRKVAGASFVAAISSHTRSQLMRRSATADWGKIKVVHCGLARPDFLRDASLTAVPDALVCVARLDPEKGQLVLLEALNQVRKSHRGCRLVLVGDGPMRQELEERIAALGLADHVTLTGWLTSAQVRDQIRAARALVLASSQEGLPVVIMEAMALERPVIATYVAGIPELVLPGKTGWLVPAGSVSDLAVAIDACLSAAPEELRRMGEAARTRAMTRHDVDVEARKLASLFAASSEQKRTSS